ncbi:MAG: DUF4416 family protein [Deltaproteobacteria bacterium]|nr:DUF4416 family protein [Deltaproteobacteria bacterium]
MGKIHIPDDVMLFCSLIFRDEAFKDNATSLLKERFGEVVFHSKPFAFDFTRYYEEELGRPLYRTILAFAKLAPRDSLVEVKIITNLIEAELADKGRRRLNLDPGILTQENICLATTKPYSHRIYLGGGIWADLTLMYKDSTYCPLRWTYPDYRSEEMINVFNFLRRLYKEKIRCLKA